MNKSIDKYKHCPKNQITNKVISIDCFQTKQGYIHQKSNLTSSHPWLIIFTTAFLTSEDPNEIYQMRIW